MIDIVTEKNTKIKNIKQIGTPQEEDRIYLSDYAYRQMHENNFEEKSVYILMGHTENSNGRYATFVEAAIPVRDIEFEKNIPIWNNQIWKRVFTKIKEDYEELIIVGWGMDLKGFPPRETPELEKVHREQFGGIHQLLFLMNSLEQDECFFINKNNRLYKKTGFFVYYQVKHHMQQPQEKKDETPKVDIEIPEQLMEGEHVTGAARGRYRELLKQQKQFVDMTPYTSFIGYGSDRKELGNIPASAKERRVSYGLVAAIAFLVVAIGGNLMSDGLFSTQVKTAVQTMGQSVGKYVTNTDPEDDVEGAEYVGDTTETEELEEGKKEGDTEQEIIKIPVEEY